MEKGGYLVEVDGIIIRKWKWLVNNVKLIFFVNV